MSIVDIVTLSVALALDAAVVSLALGTQNKTVKTKHVLFPAVVFALFQMVMPLVGYAVANRVVSVDPLFGRTIAAGVFALIGVRFVYESIKQDKKENILPHPSVSYSYERLVFFLGLITSVDALVAGASFSFLQVDLKVCIISIGLITFLLSLFTGMLGRTTSRVLGDRVEIFGGCLLFILSLRLLFFS